MQILRLPCRQLKLHLSWEDITQRSIKSQPRNSTQRSNSKHPNNNRIMHSNNTILDIPCRHILRRKAVVAVIFKKNVLNNTMHSLYHNEIVSIEYSGATVDVPLLEPLFNCNTCPLSGAIVSHIPTRIITISLIRASNDDVSSD